ncbi:hypothetical protein C5S35_06815 [Candidatus Methanophagaceae archaeon]|jgi:hypothetical protein|nr:hypothetical protein C5S35_06815 [Methanophagales archaeon]
MLLIDTGNVTASPRSEVILTIETVVVGDACVIGIANPKTNKNNRTA